MKFEVKVMAKEKNGRAFNYSDIATECELTKKGKLDAVKYLKEGKSRYTWQEIPNDYQMSKYYESFEIVITEATTGKRVWSYEA